MALTAGCAVAVVVATPHLRTPIWRTPVWLGPVAVFCLPFFAWFVLFGPRRHWIRFGKAVGFALGGMAFGVLLFESPLPGALAGLLSGSIFTRINSLPRTGDNGRRKAMIRFYLVVAFILFASVGLTWRHHLAKYVIRRSGGRVYWGAQNPVMFGNRTRVVASALGPYLVPSNTYASFSDAPVKSGGVAFHGQDLERLRPHLESIHGLNHLNVWSRDFGDDDAKQLVGLTSLTGLALIDTKLTNAGVRSLSDLKQLTWLNLHGSSVTDDVVQPLLSFPSLRFLGLGGTQITDDGVRALRRLPSLEETIVPQTGVTSAATSELSKSVRVVLQDD